MELLFNKLIGYEVLLPKICLQRLRETYSKFIETNIEIGHKWCELILKNKVNTTCYIKYLTLLFFDHFQQFRSDYDFIAGFLSEHQAMGVFLYSEMILSKVN